MGSVKGKIAHVQLALVTDIANVEKEYKNAVLQLGESKKAVEEAKRKLKAVSDKAYDLVMKYKSQADDLGLDPMKNVAYSTIDKYFQAEAELLK